MTEDAAPLGSAKPDRPPAGGGARDEGRTRIHDRHARRAALHAFAWTAVFIAWHGY